MWLFWRLRWLGGGWRVFAQIRFASQDERHRVLCLRGRHPVAVLRVLRGGRQHEGDSRVLLVVSTALAVTIAIATVHEVLCLGRQERLARAG